MGEYACKRGVRLGEPRIQADRLAEELRGGALLGRFFAAHELPAAQKELVRSEVLGAASLEPRRVTFEQRETQRAHGRSRDLFLDREDVLEQPVECLRPEQRAVGGDELRRDPHALARLAHAAVEHRAHLSSRATSRLSTARSLN